jgi:site-specific DNA recombinase
VTEAEFIAAQHIHADRPTRDGRQRRYVLSGLVRCGVCGRRMDSHWVHGRAGYRCRHGHSSSRPRTTDSPKYVYVREELLVRELIDQTDSPSGGCAEKTRLGDIASTVSKLRQSGQTILHDGRSWSLSTNQ